MFLIDTNILSTFAKVNKARLLLKLFNKKICVSVNVFEEIKKAQELGYGFANKVIEFVKKHNIRIVSANEKEILMELPNCFGLGEKDSIAICKNRNHTFVSNELRVINYCKENKIQNLTLNNILHSLWKLKILSKEEVKRLMNEMEEKDNLIITSKKEILED